MIKNSGTSAKPNTVIFGFNRTFCNKHIYKKLILLIPVCNRDK